MNEVHLLIDGSMRRRIQAAAARHIERIGAGTIDLVQEIEKPCFSIPVLRRFQNDRSRSVAKNDASGAVGVVDNRRHYISSDNHDTLVSASGDELRAILQRKKKRRTRSRKIHAPNLLRSKFVLHQARSGR